MDTKEPKVNIPTKTRRPAEINVPSEEPRSTFLSGRLPPNQILVVKDDTPEIVTENPELPKKKQKLEGNRQPKAPLPRIEDSSETSGDDHFDPNHLLAHVQALKAVEESDLDEDHAKHPKAGPEHTTQKALDDSEESNTIPLSAIPSVNEDISDQQEHSKDLSDLSDLTIINLQKDVKNTQNFKRA